MDGCLQRQRIKLEPRHYRQRPVSTNDQSQRTKILMRFPIESKQLIL